MLSMGLSVNIIYLIISSDRTKFVKKNSRCDIDLPPCRIVSDFSVCTQIKIRKTVS